MIVCLVQTPTAKLYINYKSAKLEGKVRILHDGRGIVVKWEHASIKMFLVYHQEQPHRRVGVGEKETDSKFTSRLEIAGSIPVNAVFPKGMAHVAQLVVQF